MSEPVLTLRGFGVSFGQHVVLSDVSLELTRPSMTTLVGPAGSGKSTLLRTLAGLNDAHPSLYTWGTAVFDGCAIHTGGKPVPAPGELRPGVGMVVQHARFFLDSVRDNLVSVLPRRSELEHSAQTRRVTELLELNGLTELIPRLGEDVASLGTSLQRRLAIVRALVADPRLLLVDEPTAGLDDDDAMKVVTLLRVQAGVRAVLFVTHNQRFARAAGGFTALLAGGKIREHAPTERFFDAPETAFAQSFVRTGGCVVADRSPLDAAADPEADSPATLPPPTVPRSRFEGPRGFFWLEPGRLGGLPRPGIVSATHHDLAGLRRLGVTTLVTLEEVPLVDAELLRQFGISRIHLPVPDMGAPTLEAAAELCQQVSALIAKHQVVAMHCRAGLGRTGTLLACHLIWSGGSAADALDRVRRLNPQCVQSQVQVEFLSAFESFTRARADRVSGGDGPAHTR